MLWAFPKTGGRYRELTSATRADLDTDTRELTLHVLRHTFASRLARAGVPLQQIQRLLGHADPKLTAAVYTQLETEDLWGAIELLNPTRLPHE